jgi:hypothetical protein
VIGTEFTCACCGLVFTCEWTDEEARAEAVAAFGPDALAEADLVCEDCYELVLWAMRTPRGQTPSPER